MALAFLFPVEFKLQFSPFFIVLRILNKSSFAPAYFEQISCNWLETLTFALGLVEMMGVLRCWVDVCFQSLEVVREVSYLLEASYHAVGASCQDSLPLVVASCQGNLPLVEASCLGASWASLEGIPLEYLHGHLLEEKLLEEASLN